MPSVTSMTAAAVEEIEAQSFNDVDIVGDGFQFTRGDASTEEVGSFVTRAYFDANRPSGQETGLIPFYENYVHDGSITSGQENLGYVIFDVVDRPVIVELDIPWIYCTVASVVALASLGPFVGGVIQPTRQSSCTIPLDGYRTLRVVERIDTPGNYTRWGTLHRWSGTGTIGLNINPDNPLSTITLTAVEM